MIDIKSKSLQARAAKTDKDILATMDEKWMYFC